MWLYDAFKVSGETPTQHASAIRKRGDWVPIAWPHDGMDREKGSNIQLAQYYEDEGVNMLPDSARYDDDKGGAQPIGPGISEMHERMLDGRLKVFSDLEDFFKEFRVYHRKDGKIVPKNDDLVSALRYGMIMKRYAIPQYMHRRIITHAPMSPIVH